MKGMDRDSELALVGRLRAGDLDAFDAVHDCFNTRLFNFLARLSRRREVAEDLLDETWLRLVARAAHLQADTRLGPWLFTVARNLYISYRRSRALEDSHAVGLNGLWLLEHFKGEFAGMPFEGRGATSYDPAKKKYVKIWIDSVSTRPTVTEGTYDKSTKTMTLVGNMPLPEGKSMKGTQIIAFKDANTKTYTLIGTRPDGTDFEMMQVTYKRREK